MLNPIKRFGIVDVDGAKHITQRLEGSVDILEPHENLMLCEFSNDSLVLMREDATVINGRREHVDVFFAYASQENVRLTWQLAYAYDDFVTSVKDYVNVLRSSTAV